MADGVVRGFAAKVARRVDAMYQGVGENIQRQPEDAGISQHRLAEAAIDQSYLAKIEEGNVRTRSSPRSGPSLDLVGPPHDHLHVAAFTVRRELSLDPQAVLERQAHDLP